MGQRLEEENKHAVSKQPCLVDQVPPGRLIIRKSGTMWPHVRKARVQYGLELAKQKYSMLLWAGINQGRK